MAFELFVTCETIPANLAEVWEKELSAKGIVVEVLPGFLPSEWAGGFLPIKLIELPESYRFRLPSIVQISGFEVGFTLNSAHFRTAMGRTIAELILQCSCTAILAAITGGMYIDPQTDKIYEGERALKRAHDEIMEYEPYMDDASRTQHGFTRWSDYRA